MSERFVGVQWLGGDTPAEHVEWLEGLPEGPSNVKSVEIEGDVLRLTTHLTESTLNPGDYVVYGGNRQPLVMPASVFERRYEEIRDE